MTGLAAGFKTGIPVYEAATSPGGICSSYYVRPGETERSPSRLADGSAYRFEIGGGHWIFGGDRTVLNLIRTLSSPESYARRSSVFFHEDGKYVPYPLQDNLRSLDPETIAKVLTEVTESTTAGGRTMAEWLVASFGKTLCESFFLPFHDLYTAGLHREIAPQDAYKSPVNRRKVIQGALQESTRQAGYNVEFLYPSRGLDHLASSLAKECTIHYDMRADSIDPETRIVRFADGTEIGFDRLIATLPLNRLIEMTGLSVDVPPDPYTSVSVLNIGALKGPNCPSDHWIYVRNTRAGFHRVGFYSNVTPDFLPVEGAARRTSLYVERAHRGGERPSPADLDLYAKRVVEELREWGYIEEVEVVDPTWIEVAYTWSWPGSNWVSKCMSLLESKSIHPVGRYARWHFQGIADSIRDGLIAGAVFQQGRDP